MFAQTLRALSKRKYTAGKKKVATCLATKSLVLENSYIRQSLFFSENALSWDLCSLHVSRKTDSCAQHAQAHNGFPRDIKRGQRNRSVYVESPRGFPLGLSIAVTSQKH